MKFLKKLKSSNFWVSMISAVVLILQAVFNVEIKTEYLTQIVMSILGLLVMSGIVTDAGSDEVTVKQNIDIDSLKQNVTEMISQATQAFENSFSTITKQLNNTSKSVEKTEAPQTESVRSEITIEPIQEKVSAEPIVGAEMQTSVSSNQALLEQVIIQPNVDKNNEIQNM